MTENLTEGINPYTVYFSFIKCAITKYHAAGARSGAGSRFMCTGVALKKLKDTQGRDKPTSPGC